MNPTMEKKNQQKENKRTTNNKKKQWKNLGLGARVGKIHTLFLKKFVELTGSCMCDCCCC